MKKKYVNKLIALAVATIMSLSIVACGSEKTSADNGDVTSITLYPANASLTSGVVGGYMGEYLASRGLEIEVWAYSDDKTNAIMSSGDLPDVMYVTAEQLEVMIESDMVLELDEYLDDMPHVVEQEELLAPAFNYIREFRSNDTGKVYCMPTSVGPSAASGQTDRNRVSVNWEIYKAAGYPEINSLADLIDVMKVMMETQPEDETGAKIWGCQMNAGSDATYFGSLILWYRWQGFSEENLPYLLETDMVNGTYASILNKDSLYYEGLKFYNKAYREGVFDPDSINIDRSTQGKKTKMVSSGTNPGWHDTYFEVYVPGTTIYYKPGNTYGSTNCYLVVNADTENLDGCLKFMDMLSDSAAQIYASMGPEGDFWYTTEDGHLLMTEKAHEYYQKADGSNYTYDNGEEAYLWNTAYILNTGVETGYLGYDESPIVNRHSDWAEEMQYTTNTENYNDWKEHTGYNTWQELLLDKGAWVSESPLDNVINFASTPDDTMQLTVDAIKDVVVNASWKMVYAESDEDFDKIWDKMITDCEGLGAQDIINWRLADLENAKTVRDSLN